MNANRKILLNLQTLWESIPSDGESDLECDDDIDVEEVPFFDNDAFEESPPFEEEAILDAFEESPPFEEEAILDEVAFEEVVDIVPEPDSRKVFNFERNSPGVADKEPSSDDIDSEWSDEDDIPLSTVKNNMWDQKSRPHPVEDFTGPIGGVAEFLRELKPGPRLLFHQFFTEELIDLIVFQTNLYATQKMKPFQPTNSSEIRAFIAINLIMGIKRLPSYRDYWSNNPILHDSYISQVMTVKRFDWLLGNLHINDNSLMPKRGDLDFDKLYKVRPLLDVLSNRFVECYELTEFLAVDESMIKFKGRSGLKQYMPKKPTKRGYKNWALACSSGYLHNFQLYTGKIGDTVEKNLGKRVVEDMCQLVDGKYHKVFFDNYFNSVDLQVSLYAKKIYASGTVNLTRIKLPKDLPTDKEMDRGDFAWRNHSTSNLSFVKWKDNRTVTFLSNFENPETSETVDRKNKDGTISQINCPSIVKNYNKNMGFVDKLDHLKKLYEVDRQSQKWWHRIFFYFLDVALVNSYICFRELQPENKLRLKEYRLEVAREEIEKARRGLQKRRRSSSKYPMAGPKKPYVPDYLREDASHIPVRTTLRRCGNCSTKKKQVRTKFMCRKCNIPLCLAKKKGKNCFADFHTPT